MAFRNIIIENPAKITVKNDRLVVKTDTEHSIPVEDITALLLESRQSTITTAALSLLGQSGCAVFICDEKHLPCAIMTPYQQHSRQLSVLKAQLDMGQVKKKHIWQQVVKAKILNQAECLRLTGNITGATHLENMSERVTSGDIHNIEAQAAQYYFPHLFGEGFTRADENVFNAGLNYGYAILRGYTARCLAVYGFNPCIGLHHKSELNAFNLADDLMEPFRPVIDLIVKNLFHEETEMVTANKRMLANCLNMDIISNGQHHSVAYAIELEVKSLSHCMDSEKDECIHLPKLVDLKMHTYE